MNPPINQNTNPTNQAQYRQVNTPQLLFFLTHKLIRVDWRSLFFIFIFCFITCRTREPAFVWWSFPAQTS